MSTSDEEKNPFRNILVKSWEIWDFLQEKAGLDIVNYDQHIGEEICKQLSITFPCKDIKKELQRRDIPPEVFIGAFLKAFQPYAQMMSELCIFFYLNGIKKTNEEMKILFDFGKGKEDLGFDLKHFREFLWRYSKVSQYVSIYGWNHNTLWSLAGIFRGFWPYNPRNSNAQDWLFNYGENRKFSHPFPIPPPIGIEEIDFWLQRVWQVWTTIVLECRKFGSNRDDLREYVEIQKKDSKEIEREEREESYESIRRSQELPDFKEWDARTLYILDSDRWPESMLRGLFGFIEELMDYPESERLEKARPTIQEIQNLFSQLPYFEGTREAIIKEFIELLNLPIWKRRHELYQTWILTQIDRALTDYQRTIHHVNGDLILRFSGTHVGTVETERGRIHIWSELRSPLDNPLGKGRKGHIQPDYSLSFEPVTAPSQTVVAIECKQYLKPSPKNFSDALNDYARGRPNADVLLVNYGDMSKNMINRIDTKLRARTSSIGNLRPDNFKEIQKFKRVMLKSFPKPIIGREAREAIEGIKFDNIGVDISGSMEDFLDENIVLEILQMVINSSASARLLAIDTEIKKEWSNPENGLKELLRLSRNGGTDLPEALSGYDLEKSVVLTDKDGLDQLSNMIDPPYLIIEVGAENTLHFHFKK